MMKLRRRPLSVNNVSPQCNSHNSIVDQPSRKRRRNASHPTPSVHDEDNHSDIENDSSMALSDGEWQRYGDAKCTVFSSGSDDDSQISTIRTRSIAAAAASRRKEHRSSSSSSSSDGIWQKFILISSRINPLPRLWGSCLWRGNGRIFIQWRWWWGRSRTAAGGSTAEDENGHASNVADLE